MKTALIAILLAAASLSGCASVAGLKPIVYTVAAHVKISSNLPPPNSNLPPKRTKGK